MGEYIFFLVWVLLNFQEELCCHVTWDTENVDTNKILAEHAKKISI